jgi:hypothetical protein
MFGNHDAEKRQISQQVEPVCPYFPPPKFPKVDTWLTPETLPGEARFSNLNKVTVRRAFHASPQRSGAKPSRAQRRRSIIHDLLRRAAGFQRADGTLDEHNRSVNSYRVHSFAGVTCGS